MFVVILNISFHYFTEALRISFDFAPPWSKRLVTSRFCFSLEHIAQVVLNQTPGSNQCMVTCTNYLIPCDPLVNRSICWQSAQFCTFTSKRFGEWLKSYLRLFLFPIKESMAEAMEQYPDSCAVLVRRHGVYVWGQTWQKAKAM